MRRIYARQVEVWKREQVNGKFTYTTIVKVTIAADPAEGVSGSGIFVFKTEALGNVQIESFSKGPRGGYSFSPGIGLSESEWKEINHSVETAKAEPKVLHYVEE